MAFPKYLRENGYANPTDPNNSPWHVGHSTDMSPFAWLQKNPEHMGYFLPWMAGQREGLPIFLDVIDFREELAQGSTESTPLFVDVGGAMGHQCIALKQRCPTVPGRIILQELAHVIAQVKASPLPGFDGIEAQAYDFFTPQPIRGTNNSLYMSCFLKNHSQSEVKPIVGYHFQAFRLANTGVRCPRVLSP